MPSRYNSSRAKCIKCVTCGLFFSPNKFIFHSHQISTNDKYTQPDAANFNSWRRHLKLIGDSSDKIEHAWEDVKAMFNGGTRRRNIYNTANSFQTKAKMNLSNNNLHNAPKHQLEILNQGSSSKSLRLFETNSKVFTEITANESSLPNINSNYLLAVPNSTRVLDYVWQSQHYKTDINFIQKNDTPSSNLSILPYLPWLARRNQTSYTCKCMQIFLLIHHYNF